jgi:hypothetical protein
MAIAYLRSRQPTKRACCPGRRGTTLAASGFNGVAGRVTMTPTKVRDAELPPNGDEID